MNASATFEKWAWHTIEMHLCERYAGLLHVQSPRTLDDIPRPRVRKSAKTIAVPLSGDGMALRGKKATDRDQGHD